MADNNAPTMQATLGLTGLTMNAMALIAPGAFLWLTFFLQSTEGATTPAMWTGHRPRTSAVSGHRRLLCGNGEVVPRNGQFVLLRGAVFSQS